MNYLVLNQNNAKLWKMTRRKMAISCDADAYGMTAALGLHPSSRTHWSATGPKKFRNSLAVHKECWQWSR